MEKRHEFTVNLLEEAGYKSAMIGLSYNKNQEPEDMPGVGLGLSTHDGGHNKFLEHIIVWMEVRAPRYWWQEADTFRLSSKNSQSTMHTILKGYLAPGDFELSDVEGVDVDYLNAFIKAGELFLLKRKLPEGFMQKRMWMMSYKTLRNVTLQRKNHKMPHWQTFLNSLKMQVEHPELLPFK